MSLLSCYLYNFIFFHLSLLSDLVLIILLLVSLTEAVLVPFTHDTTNHPTNSSQNHNIYRVSK